MGTKTLYLPDSAQPGMPRAALPRQLHSEVAAENRQMVEEFEHVTGALAYYDREVRQIDEHLRIVLAKPETTVEGLKPGYYHIVRMRPGHPSWIKPIEGPNGEWRDLDGSVFDLIHEADLWNDRTQREIRQKQRRAEEARKRQKDREAMARAAEFDDRLKHAQNVQILVPRGVK